MKACFPLVDHLLRHGIPFVLRRLAPLPPSYEESEAKFKDPDWDSGIGTVKVDSGIGCAHHVTWSPNKL